MTDTETIIDRIVAVEREIAGIANAFDQKQASYQAVTLPAFENITRGAVTYSQRDSGEEFVDELLPVLLCLFVAERTIGVEDNPETACRPFYDSVRDAFFARPGLSTATDGPLDGVIARLMGHSGATAFSRDGHEYSGIEWRLVVRRRIPIVYVD